jgi:hypothetical protein
VGIVVASNRLTLGALAPVRGTKSTRTKSRPVVFTLFLVGISRYVIDRPDPAEPLFEGKG